MTFESSDFELFKDLTSFDHGSRTFDLHNDYFCKSFNYDAENKSLTIELELRRNPGADDSKLIIIFNFAKLTKFKFPSKGDFETIDILYRGRFNENGNLSDFSSEGQGYFYLDFESGGQLEFFSRQIQVLEI